MVNMQARKRPTPVDQRARIVTAAVELVRERGIGDLTFESVARQLGVTKQAIIYWFARKEDLIASVGLPALEAEARVAIAAIDGVAGEANSVVAFVQAIAEFHLSDLDRFRLIYISPQVGGRAAFKLDTSVQGQVHAVTSTMYAALQARLTKRHGSDEARRRAVAIHTSVLGLILLVAMADKVDDPLAHDPRALVTSLAALLAK
jgi:AcrR family transcriptional regulator